MWKALLDVFLPEECLACARVLDGTPHFCPECRTLVQKVQAPWCVRCGEPQAVDDLCPRCRAAPPPMMESHAPFIHQGTLARAIHRWKYEDHPELTRPLAELLVRAGGRFLEDAPARIAAIPLHRQRLWKRRYDQAELLAREVAALTGRRHEGGLLRRARPTRRQVGLLEEAREANVREAFIATRLGTGEGILLIDDVLTTGATARAATRALQAGGFGGVFVMTLARAHSGL